jgi:hypothetical protein
VSRAMITDLPWPCGCDKETRFLEISISINRLIFILMALLTRMLDNYFFFFCFVFFLFFCTILLKSMVCPSFRVAT